MSWITRCPGCGVTYTLVPDQLKVAQGWLRCGQCQFAFDSTGWVLDWPLEAPNVNATETQPGAAERLDIDALLKYEDRSSAQPQVSPVAAFEEALSTFVPQPITPAPSTPAAGVFGVPLDAMLAPDEPADEGAQTRPPAQTDVPAARSKWPVVLLVSLLLTLMVQGLWVGRHALSAFNAALVSPLQEACRFLGCDLSPVPVRDAVVIDSSGLTPSDEGLDLVWSVRNTTGQLVPMPALELSLLDAQGHVLVRRVVSVAEQAAPQTLAAGQIWSGQLQWLPAEGLQTSGYKLVSFYP